MKLEIRRRGDGPVTIALIHGLGADSTTWTPFVDELLSHVDATVISPDLRGHGNSRRANDYSIQAMAADLVETLPSRLDVVMGHSLGGTVLERAVSRLGAERAIYLDPGFNLSLPTAGWHGQAFWAFSPLTLTVSALATKWKGRSLEKSYPRGSRELNSAAQKLFDRSMARRVFKDVAFHPVAAAAPVVPSTVLLTGESASVLPDRLAGDLATFGWDIRALPQTRHDAQLQDPVATFRVLADVFV